MPRITVLGAGMCGLAAAMLLARDGHDVTVLERDPAPVPDTLDAALNAWERDGVAQFQQAHFLHPRGREVLESDLPDVYEALLAAGGYRFHVLDIMPPSIEDRAPRPGDERYVTVTARRPTLEWVFARAADREPGVEVRRGVAVEALVAQPVDGLPHVTGVRTAGGDEIASDLVVDAMGRRSPLPRMLERAGAAPVHEESEDSGFIYYTRFYRANGSGRPSYRTAPLTVLESFSVLTLQADNDTWSVTLYVGSGDRPLKALRHEDRWEAAVRACPRNAHWLDGEAITGVLPMGGLVDRYRRMTAGGQPVATGVLAVGDAWACTNPSLGRGITLGLVHGRHLRDFTRLHLEHPREMAEVWDRVTESELAPWYRSTVREDRARLLALDAARNGAPPPAPPDEGAALRAALPAVSMRDPDLFRAMVETRSCFATPEEVLARPGVADRVRELAAEPTPGPRGPNRAQLLELLA
jgi:2-polyprenyl-6-methoxyphenol hydroxylase-like FAD-dependent oxidoreductase